MSRPFETNYGISLAGLVAIINSKPRIKIEGPAFVGYYGGDCYVLAPMGSGLAEAIRKMSGIRREVLTDQLGGRA